MLMVWAALFYVLLSVWATMTPSVVVRNIAALVPFWVVYLLLLVNTGFCLWLRLPALLREVAQATMSSRGGLRWRHPVSDGATREQVRRTLRSAGYSVGGHASAGLLGSRARWGALGTVAFHAAFFVIAVGFLLTSGYRSESRVAVAEGEDLGAAATSGEAGARVADPPPRVRVDEVSAEFWRDQLLFTSLTAAVTLEHGTRKQVRINRPLWLGWGSFLRLTSFGWAPAYELLDARGRVLEASVVKMNVFPSGRRDHFRLVGYPHRVYVEVYPDAELHGERLHTKSFNLVNPTLFVRVSRGKLILAQDRLRVGEEIAFEGLRLRFSEIRYFGEFTLLSDPGAPVVVAGFVLLFAGLLVRLRGRRAEIVWEPGPDGRGGELCGYGAAEPPAEEEAT